MKLAERYIYLADDDADDREMFEEALNEVSPAGVHLATAANGVELMEMLAGSNPTPEVIFLDLNMPLKNGFECLEDIRKNEQHRHIPVVVYSTSCEKEYIDRVYRGGANRYICKPDTFQSLRSVISKVLAIDWEQNTAQPARDNFVISH